MKKNNLINPTVGGYLINPTVGGYLFPIENLRSEKTYRYYTPDNNHYDKSITPGWYEFIKAISPSGAYEKIDCNFYGDKRLEFLYLNGYLYRVVEDESNSLIINVPDNLLNKKDNTLSRWWTLEYMRDLKLNELLK